MLREVSGELAEGLAGLGLAGGISGTSAYLQYGKGRKTGKMLQPSAAKPPSMKTASVERVLSLLARQYAKGEVSDTVKKLTRNHEQDWRRYGRGGLSR